MTRLLQGVITLLCVVFCCTIEPAAAQTRQTFTLNGLNADVIAPGAITAGEPFFMVVELRPQGSAPLEATGVTLDARPLGHRPGIPLSRGFGDPVSHEWFGAPSIFATPGDIVLLMTVVESTGRGGVIALPIRLNAAVDVDTDTLPDRWERDFGLSTESATGDNGPDGDPDGDGLQNRDEFVGHTHPRGFHARYFAEGVNDGFFETTFQQLPLPGGAARMLVRTVDGEGWTSSYQVAYNVNGDGQTTFGLHATTTARTPGSSVATIIESDGPFVAERSTRWPTWRTGFALSYGSHNSEGTGSLSTRWLFAEGVVGAFHTYVTLLNPSPTQTAALTVTYFGADGAAPVVRQHTVAPDSRATIDVNFDAVGLASNDLAIVIESSVPIAAERSIYRDVGSLPWGAGTSSVGASAPALQWVFAEGLANPLFDTYLLLLNPEATPAQVEIQALRADGAPITLTRTIAPRSRATVHMNSAMPALMSASASFGMTVRSTNGTPIVAERTMWWNDPVFGTRWLEGHTSMGAPEPATRWLAPGNILTGAGGDVAVYLLLANPGAVPATVRVTLTASVQGAPTGDVTLALPAFGRATLDLTNTFPTQPFRPDGRLYGVLVESIGDTPAPIVAERSLYANTLSAIWELGSNSLLTRLPPATP